MEEHQEWEGGVEEGSSIIGLHNVTFERGLSLRPTLTRFAAAPSKQASVLHLSGLQASLLSSSDSWSMLVQTHSKGLSLALGLQGGEEPDLLRVCLAKRQSGDGGGGGGGGWWTKEWPVLSRLSKRASCWMWPKRHREASSQFCCKMRFSSSSAERRRKAADSR